jgi:hypothetical protein
VIVFCFIDDSLSDCGDMEFLAIYWISLFFCFLSSLYTVDINPHWILCSSFQTSNGIFHRNNKKYS